MTMKEATPRTDEPREVLLDKSLEDFTLDALRVACSHWSAARDTKGELDIAECEVARVHEGRAKEAIKQMSRENAALFAQVEELRKELEELKRGPSYSAMRLDMS